MIRRAAKIDDNQREIVAALREIGCSVRVTSHVGAGFPDLVVGYRYRTILLEIKDDAKSPSRRKLTGDQVQFRDNWRGHYAVVENVAEAIDAVQEAVR